jgi:hypothetical protein
MGSAPSQRYVERRRQQRARRRRPLWIVLALVVLAALGLAAGILWWSGATLAGDAVALARVEVQPLGGSLVSARAFGAGGARIPLSVTGGRLVPRTLLTPGEKVSVVVRVRRPSWLGWALGHSRTERLTLHAPVAHVSARWFTVALHAPVVVRFTTPVA